MASIRQIALKSGVSYQARVHRGGKQGGMFQKSFPSLAEARKWAREIESKIDKDEKVNPKADKFTVSNALAAYLEDQKASLANGEAGMIANLNADFGKKKISELTRDFIKKYMETLQEMEIPLQDRKKIHPYYSGGLNPDGTRKKYAKGTVRKYYLTLKKALELYSIKRKFSLDPHLFVRQDVPTAWEPKDRRLEDGEEQALYDKAATSKSLELDALT